jgi:hypothetical protein
LVSHLHPSWPQAAKLFKEEFPEAAAVIKKQLNVDDCIAGADTDEKAILLGLALALAPALCENPDGVRKWRTNSQLHSF